MQRIFLICLLVVSEQTALALSNTNWEIDNAGVREKASYREGIGGNNVWGTLKVVRSGQMVFRSESLRVGFEGYKIVDVDDRNPGKEILIFRRGEPKPGIFMGDSVHPCRYKTEAYRFDSRLGKYVVYWQTKSRKYFKPGNFGQVLREFQSQVNERLRAEKKAMTFVRAIAEGDWAKVNRLKEKQNPWIKAADYRKFQDASRHFEPSFSWLMYPSPHEPENLCFVAHAAKKVYTIIVTSTGVEMGEGGDWD